MLLRTLGVLLLATVAADGGEQVWSLDPASAVSGSITFDTTSPNFSAGGLAELGSGITDYEFRVDEFGIVWTTEDVVVFGLANVQFGGTTSPEVAMASFFLFDTETLGPTTNILTLRPDGDGLHAISYGDRDNLVPTGTFRFRLIPEPTTLALALLAATVGVRRR